MASSVLSRLISAIQSISAAARTASVNGAAADLAAFESAAVVFVVGTITDGTHTPKLQDSNDNFSSDTTDVVAADLDGAFGTLATGTAVKVGYKGRKRYLRAVVTVAGATTGGVYGAVILRGEPHAVPAPTP